MFSGRKKDELENTLLRTVILFNQRREQVRADDNMLKAILSIITKGAGNYTLSDITEVLRLRFGLEYDDNATRAKIAVLKKEKFVAENPNGTFRALQDSGEGSEFYNSLEAQTQKLILNIVNRVERGSYLIITDQDKQHLSDNTRKALSAYYQLYGYSFFNIKDIAEDDKIIDAVDVAKEGLSEKLGEALVCALFDVINSPTEEEKTILEMWARAFVALEILNLDPALRNFKLTRIKDKTFVVDTDVLLHCLAGHARYSKDYLRLMDILRDTAGCQIIIPSPVLSEVVRHLDNAPVKFRELVNPEELTDELIEHTNVFVAGYVKMIREQPNKADCEFATYLDNIYDRRYDSILSANLDKIFGKKRIMWAECDLAEITEEREQRFAEKIKKHTEHSIKGAAREDYQNEDIANSDARIYLTISNRNKDVVGTSGALNLKTYLLTKSKKIGYSAEKVLNDRLAASCICTPEAMLSVLVELGITKKSNIAYVNLFENPFLVYTAEKIWHQIEPVLKIGASLKHKDLERLRLDVDTQLDNMIVDGRFSEDNARQAKSRGYEFPTPVQELDKQNQILAAKAIKQEKEIARLKAQLEKNNEREERHKKAQSLASYEARARQVIRKGTRNLRKRK